MAQPRRAQFGNGRDVYCFVWYGNGTALYSAVKQRLCLGMAWPGLVVLGKGSEPWRDDSLGLATVLRSSVSSGLVP